jgi:hypothetical protein
MRTVLSEKNLVIVLFILVLVAFSFAHEDSKKMEQFFAGANQSLNSSNLSLTQNITPHMSLKKRYISTVNLSN